MWRIIMLCIVTMSIATVDKVSYEGYKLFSMVPKTKRHMRILNDFENMSDAKHSFLWSFWERPSVIDREVLLMVPPHNLDQFYKIIDDFNTGRILGWLSNDAILDFEVRIDDIQKVIDETIPQNKSQDFDFEQYHTLEEIYDNLEELAKKYPNKVQVVVGGRTYEGREIKGVKIISGEGKRGIFIEGGIHAREWISPATAMYILHQLLTSNNSDVRYLADTYNWLIFPVFNPDGYVFSHVKDRLWKKNRKPSSDICFGSDLNRNWDFRWNSTGSSNNPCDDDYPGSEPFSEIEMKTIFNYMLEYNTDHFNTYISLHGFSQQLLFPSSPYLMDHLYHDLYLHGKIITKALKQRYHTQYEMGTTDEHRLSGSSVDYLLHVFHKPIVFLYKLRDKGQYGFLLPPQLIIPTGEETLDSLITLILYDGTHEETYKEMIEH
ncbi:zinc carboxypeptidase-like [Temnothorax longispinosus]|uniref:zinc carboxypeptidase-like n=1 Tax=Temnothorax longispinosus TaxID=300112 RepID=UPI003A9A37C2